MDLSNTTVLIDGNVHFSSNKYTAIAVSNSIIEISGEVSFIDHTSTAVALYFNSVLHITRMASVSFINNTGTNGGALAFYSSKMILYDDAPMYFCNNSALDTGGAIYAHGNYMLNPIETPECFYQLEDYDLRPNNSIVFTHNTAKRGGEHIYGAYIMGTCAVAYTSSKGIRQPVHSFEVQHYFKFDSSSVSFSSSAGIPTRVCICDVYGRPNCTDIATIYAEMVAYPGETFTVSVAIVRGDFGTTIGNVYAHFYAPSNIASLYPSYQYVQLINQSAECTAVSYTILSNNYHEILYLTATDVTESLVEDYLGKKDQMIQYIRDYHTKSVINSELLMTPIFINSTMLPCPPGFHLQKQVIVTVMKCYKILESTATLLEEEANFHGSHLSGLAAQKVNLLSATPVQ